LQSLVFIFIKILFFNKIYWYERKVFKFMYFSWSMWYWDDITFFFRQIGIWTI